MNPQPGLTVDRDRLLRNGREHRVVSAAIHYFRIHPGLWRDRLERVRALGCNTVETYVPWNFHQPTPDVARFDGWRDVEAFIGEAGALGLDVIVRPGPYICAEWDFGGLPWWLLADDAPGLRCADPDFLAAVDRWYDTLIPIIARLQSSAGGPVVAVQVENEYGSYGADSEYLAHLRDGLTARGIDCLLFTSDGYESWNLAGGTLPGTLATVNFGSRAHDAFAALREARPDSPLFCMEFWNGWFDHWGEQHHGRRADDAAKSLEEILAAGASVNIYMAHGGTNFGWWAGANHTGVRQSDPGYQPTTTSYDYDAPVGEAGELTEKFHLFREVIGRYAELPDGPLPAPPSRVRPQTVALRPTAALRDHTDALAATYRRRTPEPLEKLGHGHGLVLYRRRVTAAPGPATLYIEGVRDFAHVFVDGCLVGCLERDMPVPGFEIDVPDGGFDLEILVEPFGRVNYGPHITDRKGLIGSVRVRQQLQFGWDIHVMPLDDLSPVPTDAAAIGTEGPVFRRAEVELPESADAFLALPGTSRALIWVNGFLLGRHWDRGPQRTLYAPGPLWRAGSNDVVVLDMEGTGASVLEVRSEPDLGPQDFLASA
ncbi:beta-galactosidase family protein [Streptomyces sp. NPDC057565]|uniref:glycoside hydrolase family 35 protein n=1 Tax=Streptomyces sp. NPDC057565 TaxID=3346169 RepID=UPI0036B36C95